MVFIRDLAVFLITALALLYGPTWHKRMHEQRRMTPFWEGVMIAVMVIIMSLLAWVAG